MLKRVKVTALLLFISLLIGCGSKIEDNASENMNNDTAKEKVLV